MSILQDIDEINKIKGYEAANDEEPIDDIWREE